MVCRRVEALWKTEMGSSLESLVLGSGLKIVKVIQTITRMLWLNMKSVPGYICHLCIIYYSTRY